MPTPTPSPITPTPLHAIVHGVWTGLSSVAEHEPWLVVLFGLLIVTALVRSARIAIHTGPRDDVRRFSKPDKATLPELAGHRCEHHGWIDGRCRTTERLEADHVHPWSRGGWTHISNGQILCRSHNRAKSAAVPWNRSLRRLADHRAAYYPAQATRDVVRRQQPRRARSVR